MMRVALGVSGIPSCRAILTLGPRRFTAGLVERMVKQLSKVFSSCQNGTDPKYPCRQGLGSSAAPCASHGGHLRRRIFRHGQAVRPGRFLHDTPLSPSRAPPCHRRFGASSPAAAPTAPRRTPPAPPTAATSQAPPRPTRSPSRRGSGPPSSPTRSVRPATSPPGPTATSTSTPGAPLRQRPAGADRRDSWWPCGTPTRTARPTRSSASAAETGTGEPASRSSRTRCTRRPVPTSCATGSSPSELAPGAAPDTIVSGLPIEGGHPMHPFTIDPDGQPLREQRLEHQLLPGEGPRARRRRASGPARSWRPARASGASAPPGPASGSVPTPATPPGSGMPAGWRSTRPTARSTPPSTAATSWPRTGPSSTTGSRARSCPRRSCSWWCRGGDYGWPYCYYDPRAGEAGAGSGVRWRRQEGRRVRREARPGGGVPGALGAQRARVLHRRRSSPRRTAAARSSPSTARGTGRPSRRGGTTSSSSRSRAASRRATTRSSPTGSPGPGSSPGTARHRPSGLAVGTGRGALHQRRHRRAGLAGGARRRAEPGAGGLGRNWPPRSFGTAGAAVSSRESERPADLLRCYPCPAHSCYFRRAVGHEIHRLLAILYHGFLHFLLDFG